jgi:hypothetical protein
MIRPTVLLSRRIAGAHAKGASPEILVDPPAHQQILVD